MAKFSSFGQIFPKRHGPEGGEGSAGSVTDRDVFLPTVSVLLKKNLIKKNLGGFGLKGRKSVYANVVLGPHNKKPGWVWP